MRITVNSEPKEVGRGETLAALIERLGLGEAAVAAEINRVLVPKRDHAARALEEGDEVELVTLVGGG